MTGEQLEKHRKACKVTREELGDELGVPYARIQREEGSEGTLDPEFARRAKLAIKAITGRRDQVAKAALAGAR